MSTGMVNPLRTVMVSTAIALCAFVNISAQAPRPLTLVQQVRAAINEKDLGKAEALVTAARREKGDTPEVLAAFSWLGRGAMALGQKDRADAFAAQAQRLGVAALAGRSAETDGNLAIAIGAGIEVQAQLAADRGERSEAIAFLERELKTYAGTELGKRIQKNINLLTLEGRPAPALERSEWIGATRPPSLAEMKGKVVVVFFWAHWCADCKAQGPILEKLAEKYRARGLTVVAPTMRFGYVAGGVKAAADEELKYIVAVREQFYPWMSDVATPLSVANHQRYGVSTTPTLAIIDRQGIVRVYNPGRLTEAELETRIQKLVSS